MVVFCAPIVLRLCSDCAQKASMPQIADLESMLEVQNDGYSWEREICGVGVWTW